MTLTRRCAALLLLLAVLLHAAACGGARGRAPNDEVATRINAADEQTLFDGNPAHDAGPAGDQNSE